MAAASHLAFVLIAIWTVTSVLVAVAVGRTMRRLAPIPVRVSQAPRLIDLRRAR
jgi:hypothetical protein